MSAWNLYLIIMLDGVQKILVAICFSSIIIGFIGAFIFGAWHTETSRSPEAMPQKHFKKCIACFFIFPIIFGTSVIFANLVPSTKQMAAIYLIPKMINNEQIQDIGKNSLSILEEHTKKYLEELMPLSESTE